MQSISVSPTNVVIDGYQVSSPDVVKYFEQLSPEQYASDLERILEIGCMVLSRVNAAQEIDYVEARLAETLNKVGDYFVQFEQQMKETLHTSLDPADDDSFLGQTRNAINNQAEKVEIRLAELLRNTQAQLLADANQIREEQKKLQHDFDPTNNLGHIAAVTKRIDAFENSLNAQFLETDSASFVGKLRSAVDHHFGDDGQVMELIDSKLQIGDSTPLGKIYFSLRSEITGLRDAVMKLLGQQELVEQTTKKGYPFEDKVFERLQEIAKPFGDVVEDTSKKVEAISGSKKGDYVYTLAGSTTNIVLDAKNYNKLRSLPAMLAYLNEAIAERNAKVGIIVAPSADSLQKQVGEWNVYGNCIITPLSNLEISVKYAKYILELEQSDADTVNIGLVKQKLDEVQQKMKEFSVLKMKLTKLSNGVQASVEDMQKHLDTLRTEIIERLSEVQQQF